MPTPDSVPFTKQTSSNNAIAADLPRVGEWLWACRPGFEDDLITEFERRRAPARAIEPGLVVSRKRPEGDLVFARQGLPVHAVFTTPLEQYGPSASMVPLAERIANEIIKNLGSKKTQERPLALQVFSPESDAGRLRIKIAAALQPAISERLSARSLRLCADGTAAHAEAGTIAEVCLIADPRGPNLLVVVGVLSAMAAPSLFAGGVNRVRRPEGAPSRSAHKLVEALAWLGHGPESGDVCIDLGAAPGGFSQVLADRRCQVIAVDLGRLDPAVAQRVRYVKMNAFHFIPDEPADWVFCDMAYRPLEVAALLARWGRQHWARFLVSNIKLPMKKRVEMLDRVQEILATGGWTGLRMRQLYHDRDEVTLFAWRGFGMETRTRPAAARNTDPDATDNVDAKPRGKFDAKPRGKSDAKPRGKFDAKPRGKSDGKTRGKSDGKTRGKSDGKTRGKFDAKPRGKSDGYTKGKGDTRGDSRSDTRGGTKRPAKDSAKGRDRPGSKPTRSSRPRSPTPPPGRRPQKAPGQRRNSPS